MLDDTDNGLPRSVEIAIAAAGLGASAPVLLAAGVAIRLTSSGPAIFKQTRVGQYGRPFSLYKLRTMATDNRGPGVTAKGDPRITKIGRILRKTKLDELPELWNVVKGEMALVGLRPEIPEYVEWDDPLWKKALAVKPGLTHPVTLRLRNEEELLATTDEPTEFYRKTLIPYKLRACLDYVEERTWQTDLAVLWRTVWVVLRPELAPPPSLEEVTAD